MSSHVVSWIKKFQIWTVNHLSVLILVVLSLTVTVLLFRVELNLLTLSDLNGIVPDWYSPLNRPEDRVEKTLRLPDFSQHSNWYLAIYLGTNRWRDLSSKLVLEVDGIPVFKIDKDRLAFMKVEGWLKIPITQELLAAYQEKTAINIGLYSEGQSNLLINIYGVNTPDPMSDGSRFNGLSDDLSREPGQQQGDFLIQFVPAIKLPPLPAIFAFLLFPIVVYALLNLRLSQQWVTFGAAGALMLATLAVWLWPERMISNLPIILYAGYGLFLTNWILSSREQVVKQRWFIGLTLIMIVWWGFSQHWAVLPSVVEEKLAPDATRFRDFGEAMDLFSKTGFYSGSFGVHPPMWPLMVHLAFNLFATSDLVLRLTSLFFTLAVIVTTFWFAATLLESAWAGLIAATLVSVDPLWATESVRGLRTPFYTTVLLLFCVVCFGLRDSQKFNGLRRAILTGGVGGIMLLTRPNAPTILIIILVMPFLSNLEPIFKRGKGSLMPRWTFLMSFVAVLIAILCYLPHLYGMYQEQGDPFWSTKVYARWLANMEFPDRLGTPGFPSKEEFAENSMAGPSISYAQYLFELHTLPELIQGSLLGYRQVMVNITDGISLMIIYLVAFPLATVDHRRLPLPLVILVQLAPTTYLYSRQLLETYRHIIELEPLVVVATVYVLMRLHDTVICAEPKRLVGNLTKE